MDPEPRVRRPAARRGSARRLDAPRSRRLDRDVAPRGLRHRGRPGGDPRGRAPGRPRRSPGVRSMRIPRPSSPLSLLLALMLGAGCALLVACASTNNPHLLSAARADRLNGELDDVRNAVDDGDCPGAIKAVRKLSDEIASLPSDTDPALRRNLETGAQNLARRAPQDCKDNAETTPTVTETVPTVTETVPTATETTPTETTTTPTETTTTPTQTTPTPTPTSTTPASGGSPEPTP